MGEFKTFQGAKYDGDKPKLSIVPPGIIYAIEKVRAYGMAKYQAAENWKSIDPDRWHEALLRHILKIWENPKAIDPESGMPHLWHIAANLSFMIESYHMKPDEIALEQEAFDCERNTTTTETAESGGDM